MDANVTNNADRVAEVQLVSDAQGEAIKVVVPKGTSLVDAVKLHETVSGITKGLRGCQACISGVPISIIEREEIHQLVRVDLDSMQQI